MFKNSKLTIGSILALVFVFSPFLASAKSSPIQRYLSKGMNGEDVAALQSALSEDKDVYPEGLVSGFFGPMTEKAVKKFQKKYHISVVGAVGPITMARLNLILVNI